MAEVAEQPAFTFETSHKFFAEKIFPHLDAVLRSTTRAQRQVLLSAYEACIGATDVITDQTITGIDMIQVDNAARELMEAAASCQMESIRVTYLHRVVRVVVHASKVFSCVGNA